MPLRELHPEVIVSQPLSRFRGTSKAPLESPAVLKQIKNLAFHEKYIDRLHSRDARRVAGGRQCTAIKEDREENVQRMDVIKAVKLCVGVVARCGDNFREIEAVVVAIPQSQSILSFRF
ncbi:hypothetical protein IFM89_005192 [Coptis chinensis]|uniref:Uncharacterized protein n=1 Tax=Coptis chinensis TaxID=261450 RepID=A0A835I0Y5_9MAGN|nr:hypothetical protein IFM89_005192 [Coptis chinensis]